MLHIIRDLSDNLLSLIKDDPVRPEIPLEDRVNSNSRIFVLRDEVTNEPLAVTCVKFLDGIPSKVDDLAEVAVHTNTAVFYTIWSYAAGAGRRLIQEAQAEIQKQQPEIDTYVTLSPKTEMARRFHHKNGAKTYRENSDTVNYVYD
jgi:Malonyl-CoA decarboxylase C-terminal domain